MAMLSASDVVEVELLPDSVGFRFQAKCDHIVAEKILHLCITLMNAYPFKDFATNGGAVVRRNARI